MPINSQILKDIANENKCSFTSYSHKCIKMRQLKKNFDHKTRKAWLQKLYDAYFN